MKGKRPASAKAVNHEPAKQKPLALALPAALSAPAARPLPAEIDAQEAYRILRDACRNILADWADYDLEKRFAFAESLSTPLRRIEAGLILISQLPESLRPEDRPSLAASFKNGELAFLASKQTDSGFNLGDYARRLIDRET